MKLIGLSGTNGAGKDAAGELLAESHNYLFISVTEMLREECRARGLAVERENLRAISSEWRLQGGLGILIDKAVEVYEKQAGTYQGLVVASLRNPGEADRIHELGGSVVWIDAEIEVRYARVVSANRGRGAEDLKSFDQFVAEQEAEMHGVPGDPTSLKMSAVKDKSDIFISNDGNDLAEFEKQIIFTLTEASLL